MFSDQDGAEPSSNSVSSMNLIRLSSLLNKPELLSRATDIFKAFCDRMTKYPSAFAGMISAYISYQQKPKQVCMRYYINRQLLLTVTINKLFDCCVIFTSLFIDCSSC